MAWLATADRSTRPCRAFGKGVLCTAKKIFLAVHNTPLFGLICLPVDISAAADYAIVEGHQLAWKSAKVIDREKSWRSQKVKEALGIRNTESTLNVDKGWDIYPLWLSLL